MTRQIARAILMISPEDFAYNEQTALDNEFQHRPEGPPQDLKAQALQEFEESVDRLRTAGIEVLTLAGKGKREPLPDAVFPNNWLATEADGTIITFPMATLNRRAEVNQLPEVEKLLALHGFSATGMVRIGNRQEDRYFLEGTGSMILDKVNRIVYAARSVRTHILQVEAFARQLGYKEVLLFSTRSSSGQEFYHTNVVMSICEGFALVCSECIADAVERKSILDSLRKHRPVLEISLEQAEKFFCANILQVANADGDPVTVMSESAWKGFTPTQQTDLARYGEVVTLPIDTIEYVGGGSARCMMAEIYLPKNS